MFPRKSQHPCAGRSRRRQMRIGHSPTCGRRPRQMRTGHGFCARCGLAMATCGRRPRQMRTGHGSCARCGLAMAPDADYPRRQMRTTHGARCGLSEKYTPPFIFRSGAAGLGCRCTRCERLRQMRDGHIYTSTIASGDELPRDGPEAGLAGEHSVSMQNSN